MKKKKKKKTPDYEIRNRPEGPGLFRFRWLLGTADMTGFWIKTEIYDKDGRLWVKELTPQTKNSQTLLSIANRYSQDRPLDLYAGSEWEKQGEEE